MSGRLSFSKVYLLLHKLQCLILPAEKLHGSKFGNSHDIRSMVEHFEKSTKPTFKNPNEKSYVKFGSMRDKDPTVGIRGGQLQLEGCALCSFAEAIPCTTYDMIGVR